ncbi:MAG: EamA family transporter [Melioribacter sp.]|uniref:DMT family transporter n=1 Tax=Rosettibacter primus TaxID=3111523 RepID=UPI00247E9624|nr:EamA family transporter [Melioribacter sp.]
MNNKLKSFLFAIASIILWSTSATAFKLTLKGMSVTHLLLISSLTSTIIFFVFEFINNKKNIYLIIKGKDFKNNLVLGIINPFLYYLILFKAYSILPAQEALPLNYTWPIVISIFSVLFLKNKLTLRTILGLFIAFTGVIIIATRGNLISLHFHNITGVSLAIGSSVVWGLFWILNLLDSREPSEKLFGSFLFGTILIGIYTLFFENHFDFEPKYFLGSVYIGFFEMGITFFLWMKALSLSENKAHTATLAYLSPFISLIFISVILGEKLFASSILGLIFIVGGIIIQQIKTNN